MAHVVVAGSDARDRWLCRFLADNGYDVSTWGFSMPGLPRFTETAISPYMLIGPLSGIEPDGTMSLFEGDEKLTEDHLDALAGHGILAAGLIGRPIKDEAQKRGIRTVEYRQESSFMWLNAVPTAEGAIKEAIGQSGRTLYGGSVAVLGFGRVGSVLALRLQSYGARVHIFDRSLEKRSMATAYGFSAYALTIPELPAVDGIFNTVSAPVLDRRWIEKTDPAWIIDLASKPGGLSSSVEHHPQLGNRYRLILGIPGMVAPRRAAEIIWETLSMVLA